MRKDMKHAKASGTEFNLSPHDPHKKLCTYYQIKGICNVRCGRSSYKDPYPSRDNREVIEQAQNIIPGRGGDGGGADDSAD